MAPWRREIEPSAQFILGVDEAGRGPLAGPVVAAAVMLDDNVEPIVGLDDSKKLSEKVREALHDEIYARARLVAVKIIEPGVIDRINILQATLLAMRGAVLDIHARSVVDVVLVDGNQRIPDLPIPQQTIVHGDGLVPCIMAASIVAKVHRDRMMRQFDEVMPGYGFAKHKGYGTAVHLDAIKKLGPSPIHRMSFAPLRDQI